MKTPQLADKVKDVITGFTGIVTGRSEYLNGCVHYSVEAKSKAGGKPDTIWIDEQQLEVTASGAALRKKLGIPSRPARALAVAGSPALNPPPSH